MQVNTCITLFLEKKQGAFIRAGVLIKINMIVDGDSRVICFNLPSCYVLPHISALDIKLHVLLQML